MLHQVRTVLPEPTVLSLHDMEFMAKRFRVAQTEVDARCITPNFKLGFFKAGKGNVVMGYQEWLKWIIPKMRHWPIFVERATNPQTGSTWTEPALYDHFMTLCPFKKETEHLGGIMEAFFPAIPEYDNFELTAEQMEQVCWQRWATS